MRLEFRRDGYDVQFVAINVWDGTMEQNKLYERCSFPIFQDVSVPASDNVWNKLDGKKDDFYVYDQQGILRHYFRYGEDGQPTNLSTPEGYAYVKDSIVELLEP